MFHLKPLQDLGPRLSSITTRIKTFAYARDEEFSLTVRDYLPLQQGLRQYSCAFCGVIVSVRDYLPLQQGLRPDINQSKKLTEIVRDYLPLQQGLRHSLNCSES